MSEHRAEQLRAFLDHPLVRIPAGVVVSVALALAVWFGQRSVTALDAMQTQVAQLSTSLARLETLYQAQVPNLSTRLDAAEKDLRLLRWEIEMQGYHRAMAAEEAEKQAQRDGRYARPNLRR